MKTSVRNLSTSTSRELGGETPIADAQGNLMLNKLETMLRSDAIPSVPVSIVEELLQDFRSKRSEIEKLRAEIEDTIENLNSYIENFTGSDSLTEDKPKHKYAFNGGEYEDTERSLSGRFDNIEATGKASNDDVIFLIKAHKFHKKHHRFLMRERAVYMKLLEESSEVFEE